MMQLGSKYGLLVPAETSVLKNNLAQIILASACTGERDTERLKQIALRAVLGTQRAKEAEPAHC
jgi:hypothetical protein